MKRMKQKIRLIINRESYEVFVKTSETRPRSRADYRRSMSAVLAECTIKEAIARLTSDMV